MPGRGSRFGECHASGLFSECEIDHFVMAITSAESQSLAEIGNQG
jgi:hypothetical protein